MDGWPRRSLRTVPRLRIQYQVPAGIAVQHELAPDEVGIDDNIVVRRSPGNYALCVKSGRLELALDHAMLKRRRAEHGHDGRARAMAPCQLTSARAQRVHPKAVLHQQQAGRVPQGALRLVVDERGEARRPRAERTLDVQLGATQPVRRGAFERTVVGQLAAGVGNRENLAGRPGTAPAIARRQPARVLDGLALGGWRGLV